MKFQHNHISRDIEKAPEARKTVFQLPTLAKQALADEIEKRNPIRIEFCGYRGYEVELARVSDSRAQYVVFRFDGAELVLRIQRMDNRKYSGRKWY
jgi:hypothetical protein